MSELNTRLEDCRKSGGKVLNLTGLNISSLGCVREFPELQRLDCSYTQVSDLAPLSALTQLQTLYCSSTQVSDLAPLSALTQLQRLYCKHACQRFVPIVLTYPIADA